jgi:thioredoxin reductase (NADPH)
MALDPAAGNKTDGSATPAAVFPRHEQTFPTLTLPEIARMRRFGETRTYRHGERRFETGKPGPGMFVVLSGDVAISQARRARPRHAGHRSGPGQFSRRDRSAQPVIGPATGRTRWPRPGMMA